MTGYDLSRQWFDYCFENPEKISPLHTAIYFFCIEHCNRLGWKDKFGLPSQMVMEAIGIKNWRTYSKGLNDLIDWGFIRLIEKSKNQYSSNIIAIVKNTKATTKALDKALQKHCTKHSQSTASINKQETIEQETINKEHLSLNEFCKKYFDQKYINESSLDCFDKLMRIDNYTIDQIKTAIVNGKNDIFWAKNFLSPLKLRAKDKTQTYYIDIFLKLEKHGSTKSSADSRSPIAAGQKDFSWNGWKPGQAG